jgi:hypothetical protein
MVMQIEQAETTARAIRHRLWKGEGAIKALKWMHDIPIDKFEIGTSYGSAVDGHKEAMTYLNAELRMVIKALVDDALGAMQSDVDQSFGDGSAA